MGFFSFGGLGMFGVPSGTGVVDQKNFLKNIRKTSRNTTGSFLVK